jgi:hypothetical protein
MKVRAGIDSSRLGEPGSWAIFAVITPGAAGDVEHALPSVSG